jgi:hypothetical protein
MVGDPNEVIGHVVMGTVMVAMLHNVRRHVQILHRELHKGVELVSPHARLFEALEMQHQDVWQRPQAQRFCGSFLGLLAVRALPRIITAQLLPQETHTNNYQQ